MSNTGIAVDNECVNEFNAFKLRNTHRYIVFKIENAKEIKIEKKGETTAAYDEFLKQLPDNDCRYAVYNFEYNQADGFRSKIVFFLWAPDTAPTKSKMLYAGTKDTLKKNLQGLQVEMQGTDKSEVDQSEVLAKCQSLSK
eukprot:TRINITY_DN10055_c0_g1_i1.p1 TRINITY_DN10055_c0_g1~~TRINITY_DN10055_c0_g1_i1.p1  ORF type:complete len:140 (+),score=47.60 TRINITY_DN10055_c0_g1_i1:130-549(+)